MNPNSASTEERLETHVSIESEGDLPVDVLHRTTGLSKQRIKQAMVQGAVWLTRGRKTQRLRRAKRSLLVGDEVHLYYDPGILAEVPAEPKLVADLGTYSVWDKPYGLRSQGSKWGDHCTVVRWAERFLKPERPAFTVHRLDRAASGLILIAHSKSMAAALSLLFRDRKIEKRYRAIAAGDFSAHSLPLRVDEPVDGKSAVSFIEHSELLPDGKQSVLDIRIETGRKHQIRRHLAGLGHPVIGDRLYGTGESDAPDLQLKACFLAFQCPVRGERVEFQASAAPSVGKSG